MSHLFDSADPQPAGYRDVDVRRLAAERPPALSVVDVREPAELDGLLGHIEGVRPVPLGRVKEGAALWPRDMEVLLVCRSGVRSGKAAAQLVELGFTRVMNLRGGMLAWNTASLPVVRLSPAPLPSLEDVRDLLARGLQGLVPPGTTVLPAEPSREALAHVLDVLQRSPPPGVTHPAELERLLREARDLLAVASPGDARR
ncbi:rhodanese-like domain-containing protein [Myxococcus sp. K15C18031901]|uniref:rhodanese-like domain-containing protein n=1 Tax=Myxococcus dinghuensis TaxID=2906761 RepID=UPI0020A6E311|nr:rhodanese-like domain-containing protein [Myxococcus dinghuensis]MCP3099247.1 rhodanese-like domain-containing protein [Myxococcus dinghuensis]